MHKLPEPHAPAKRTDAAMKPMTRFETVCYSMLFGIGLLLIAFFGTSATVVVRSAVGGRLLLARNDGAAANVDTEAKANAILDEIMSGVSELRELGRQSLAANAQGELLRGEFARNDKDDDGTVLDGTIQGRPLYLLKPCPANVPTKEWSCVRRLSKEEVAARDASKYGFQEPEWETYDHKHEFDLGTTRDVSSRASRDLLLLSHKTERV